MIRTAAEIRQQFIDFFVQRHGHTHVPSSPVVPQDDPTLMFTNAGMNQFKPIFLGQRAADVDRWPNVVPGKATRAANSQKCIRAGGKHNDLDDVGHDTYHHTFFEMLGNWSFGDYFKREAIAWAWELLTQVWGVDPQRLHATYFQGDAAEGLAPDDEACDLWRAILPAERVHPGNKKDNFWEMGDTGPCGPCSEIHIDLTPDKSGGPLVNAGDARVMEIWNLVFIQFNRGADGRLSPLPAKHVDTGMGFERITSVLQGKRSNYDTDVFTPIFAAIRRVTGAAAYTGLLEGAAGADHAAVMRDVAYRVIADHIRTLTFALTDGALPSNEGRGYVLRRILRRAFRYGWQHLGMHRPFLCELVPAVVDAMAAAFPELRSAHSGKSAAHVAAVLRDEEQGFGRTLERGIALFDEAAQYARSHHHGKISGEDAFKLHDTFGFPIDLTELMAEERGLTVDIGEYERRMEEARERARRSSSQSIDGQIMVGGGTTEFLGYERLQDSGAVILNILEGDSLTGKSTLDAGDSGAIVLDRSPFYAEQGGQVGDRGRIVGQGSDNTFKFVVENTLKAGSVIVHFGKCVTGKVTHGFQDDVDAPQAPADDRVFADAFVDEPRRLKITQNHTATHVMNWALREVLGEHVQQRGSLVDDQKTRFDFSHPAGLSDDELRRIEALVNDQIRDDRPVSAKEAPQREALKINGLRAVFGEKYPDVVRVVSIGPGVDELLRSPGEAKWRQFSIEFCGGTHLASTGAARRFVLVEESAVAKGIRRVVGVTGAAAQSAAAEAEQLTREFDAAVQRAKSDEPRRDAGAAARIIELVGGLNQRLAGATLPVLDKNRLRAAAAELQEIVRGFQKQQARAGAADVVSRAGELLAAAPRVGGVAVVVGDLGVAGPDELRSACDSLRQKAGSAAVALFSRADDKVVILAAMTADVIAKGVKAGELVKAVAPVVGGRGGGKPDMAQGGGSDAARIPAALEQAGEWLRAQLRASAG